MGNWEWLGELMNENHALTCELIGCGERNQHLIDVALSNGAHGAKLSGAGRGGTVIALHEDPDWMGSRLLEAGAERLIRFFPGPGLTVRRI
jgi:mevalonate kinase